MLLKSHLPAHSRKNSNTRRPLLRYRSHRIATTRLLLYHFLYVSVVVVVYNRVCAFSYDKIYEYYDVPTYYIPYCSRIPYVTCWFYDDEMLFFHLVYFYYFPPSQKNVGVLLPPPFVLLSQLLGDKNKNTFFPSPNSDTNMQSLSQIQLKINGMLTFYPLEQ